jgi:hypothetical protein
MRTLLFEDNQQLWFETLRVLGHAAYGGSDIEGVIATAERIYRVAPARPWDN